jgi:hypothetical protein
MAVAATVVAGTAAAGELAAGTAAVGAGAMDASGAVGGGAMASAIAGVGRPSATFGSAATDPAEQYRRRGACSSRLLTQGNGRLRAAVCLDTGEGTAAIKSGRPACLPNF